MIAPKSPFLYSLKERQLFIFLKKGQEFMEFCLSGKSFSFPNISVASSVMSGNFQGAWISHFLCYSFCWHTEAKSIKNQIGKEFKTFTFAMAVSLQQSFENNNQVHIIAVKKVRTSSFNVLGKGIHDSVIAVINLKFYS